MNTQNPSQGVPNAPADERADQPPFISGPGPTRIQRNPDDKMVGGVCSGLGAAVGVDPVWFRLGFVFLALSTGIGFLLYLIAWIIIPEAPEGVALPPAAANNGAVAFGIFLLAIGSALFVDALLPWFDRVAWPIAVVGLGLGLIYFGAARRRS